MALTLTIGGTNFLPQYKTGSAKITAQIMNQGDTFDFTIIQKTGQNAPTAGQEVIFKDGTRTLFGGFITKLTPVEFGIGQMIEYQVEATDYTYILINKSTQQGYSGQTLHYIVNDIVNNNIDAGYGVTITGVATGPTITTVNFNHVSIRQCFEKLAKLTGYIWWMGYDKVVHFVDPNTITAAPEKITDSSANHEAGLALTVDVTQVKNDIVILGGTQESSQYTQVIVGDGSAREWVLLYPVQTMGSIELNVAAGGYVTKVVGVDPKDDETGNDFMYSPDRGSIRCTATTTTPVGGGTPTLIRVKFTYPLPVLTEVKSAPSIIAMKALEGGDGIHKFIINDSTIVSQDQAVQQALQELSQFANPILSGEFFTRTGLLQAGSYFSPGQGLTVNLPSWGINSDTVYVIQKVITTIDEGVSGLEYHYDVTFGGRLLGVIDFLQALATPEDPLDTSGEVQLIQSTAEVVTVAEVVTMNQNSQSTSDTVTASEAAMVMATITPPFKWGVNGTANKGVWGSSEWA